MGWEASAARSEVARLVSKLKALSPSERRERSEEDIKKDFLEPMFRALNWDVTNDHIPDEVVAERHVGNRKRIDYGFCIRGVPRFYLEAKDLKDDIESEEILGQAANYSYLRGVPWAVVSNFDRTILLNAEVEAVRPAERIRLNLSADQYETGFADLSHLSRDEVANGRLEAWAEAHGARARRQPIDKQLLMDLSGFRESLSREILRLNRPRFSDAGSTLDEVVQRLLDRLLFMRVAEDRGLEEHGLLSLLRSGSPAALWARLRTLFESYNQNYDSELFEPHLLDEIRVDPFALEAVIRGLHSTPGRTVVYDFAIINSDILGEMYEQYLGLLLKRTPKRAKLVNGAAHRKERGIYYTPASVARLMVRLALEASLSDGRTKPETIRLLDPACGSGSFLLQAFDALRQLRIPGRTGVQTRFDSENDGTLYSTSVAVLKENVHGVDLDPKAVEITRLNLMIRSAESRRRLPTLRRNVVVGNSLVDDPRFEESGLALDWRTAFPGATVEGRGFDVVVGNPPYVNAIELKDTVPPEVRAYWKTKFHETDKGAVDLYLLFFDQALRLARDGGVVAFITPNKYLSAPYGDAFRRWVADHHTLLRLVDLSRVHVFDPSVYPIVTIVQKGQSSKPPPVTIERYTSQRLTSPETFTVSRGTLKRLPEALWGPLLSENIDLLEKIIRTSVELDGEAAEVLATSTAGEADAYSRLLHEDSGFKIVNTGTIDRYCTTYGVRRFVHAHRTFLRPGLDIGNPMVTERRRSLYHSPKILFGKIGLRPEAFFDSKGEFASVNTNCAYAPKSGFTLPYIEAVVNSSLMQFAYGELYAGLRMANGYFQFQAPQLRHLPIARPTPAESATIETMVAEMHHLQDQLAAMSSRRTEAGARLLERASRLDTEIDAAVLSVYKLDQRDGERITRAIAAQQHPLTARRTRSRKPAR